MSDKHSIHCTEFLQWALPQLGYRWQGFKKVRKTVCKKINKRLSELELKGHYEYQQYLQKQDDEWQVLDSFCRITISLFYRDRATFNLLQNDILPELAKDHPLRCWCAGTSSGEEPYTLAMILQEKHVDHEKIMATEIDAHMIGRAERGCYPEGATKELPSSWKDKYFRKEEDLCLQEEIKTQVLFQQQDIREQMPDGPFDIVFCRNLVAMYFDKEWQLKLFRKIHDKMNPGGALLLGKHESLPEALEGFAPWFPKENIYRRI